MHCAVFRHYKYVFSGKDVRCRERIRYFDRHLKYSFCIPAGLRLHYILMVLYSSSLPKASRRRGTHGTGERNQKKSKKGIDRV
jgi:hypothetical protein